MRKLVILAALAIILLLAIPQFGPSVFFGAG
jgi:Tfp pilus assembly protein FimT